jgi:hypothetical protein
VKRVTPTKLLRASQALLALAECDDVDDVFFRYRDEVVDRMIKADGGYSSAIEAAERDMPHTLNLMLLANHLAVIAVPDID